MEIRHLEKELFAGKRFTARYLTKGYYDIRAENGFDIGYVLFDTAVERRFEDEFFSKWLGESEAYGAFESLRSTPSPVWGKASMVVRRAKVKCEIRA